jgi:hypothetical protein
VQSYHGPLANVQDVLGTLNDGATTATLLDALAAMSDNVADGAQKQKHYALGLVQGWVNARSDLQILEMDAIWQEFKKARCFW